MRRFVLLALFLGGCAGTQPDTPVYRDTATPISSMADMSLGRFSGKWQIASAFGAVAQPGDTLTITESGGAQAGVFRFSFSDASSRSLLAARTAAGRFESEDAVFWVLWVDADYRTAVIGTPSGRHGWIMDRAAPSQDRMAAAHDILDWNGYDIQRLKSGP